MAAASKAIIVAFNVKSSPEAKMLSKSIGVDIRYYSIIYEIIDDMKNLMGGLLKPDLKEKITGNVEIREEKFFLILNSAKLQVVL